MLLICSLLFLSAIPLFADMIYLKNGDFIKGKIVSQHNNRIEIVTDFGLMRVDQSRVRQVVYEERGGGYRYLLPDLFSLRLAAGLGFPALDDVNLGIQGKEQSLEATHTNEQFSIGRLAVLPTLRMRLLLRPWGGDLGRRIACYTGLEWGHSYSATVLRFQDHILYYYYGLSVLSVGGGIELTVFEFPLGGSPLQVNISAGVLFVAALFFQDYHGPASQETSLARFPATYAANGWGWQAGCTLIWRLDQGFALHLGFVFQAVDAGPLRGEIEYIRGSTRQETLYLVDGSFESAPNAPTGGQEAGVRLHGWLLQMGVQWSFGEQGLTDIPRGLYR